MQYGASPTDWQHFMQLGLTADLLPVVSNPNAKISPQSSMKALGKTPSLYNGNGEAVGIPKWTSIAATADKVERWAKQPDYGICIQTRNVRAIDIDIADKDQAFAVAKAIEAQLPCRWRENSGKMLLTFRMTGEHPKRVIKTAHGAIEFLGNGQQFVAVGRHPSGVPYQWADGKLPREIPALSPEQFEDIWLALELQFAIDTPTQGRIGTQASGEDLEIDDPVADWLEAKGLVLREEGRGLVVACPWAAEHTGGEEGDGSTMWLVAGTRGETQGHFRCLHSHCDHRTRGDYLAAVGYEADVSEEFEKLPALTGGSGSGPSSQADDVPLPGFDREKNGAIKATIGNVAAALGHRGMTGRVIGFDTFRDEIMHGPGGCDGWERFTDVDYVKLRIRLEAKGFKPIGREMMRDAIDLAAHSNTFDSAQVWLTTKVPAWDGVERIETFLSAWWGATDNTYTRGVSLYLWTALAGRVLEPGVKADMVPVLVGEQGLGKSTGIKMLAPTDETFTAVSLHEKEDDLARRIKGRLVIELDELRGLHTRELEAIKAWITRQNENWVPKYREFATSYPRRCVFFGSTNQEQFLADTTGNRRWLPVRVADAVGDFSGVREQLWAEARDRFTLSGVAWHVERLAGEAHAEHTIADPLAESVRKWLTTSDELDGATPADRDWLTVGEVCDGIGLDPRRITARSDQMRIGEILRVQFGYSRRQQRVGGARVWAYVKKSPPVTTSSGKGRDS